MSTTQPPELPAFMLPPAPPSPAMGELVAALEDRREDRRIEPEQLLAGVCLAGLALFMAAVGWLAAPHVNRWVLQQALEAQPVGLTCQPSGEVQR